MDVVICRSLDGEFLSRSVDSEVGHRERFVQTEDSGSGSGQTFYGY